MFLLLSVWVKTNPSDCLHSNTSVYCTLSKPGCRGPDREAEQRGKEKCVMRTKCRVQEYLNKTCLFTSSVFKMTYAPGRALMWKISNTRSQGENHSRGTSEGNSCNLEVELFHASHQSFVCYFFSIQLARAIHWYMRVIQRVSISPAGLGGQRGYDHLS